MIETVPKIRFKGFKEKWNDDRIEDLCSISTGKSNTQDKVQDGKYPFYVRSPIIERSNRYLYDEEAVLTVGDGVGTGKVFHYVNGKYDLHQRVYRMYEFNEKIIPKYFYYIFSKDFNDRVMSMTAKTSVDSVRYEMISQMKVVYPSLYEQKLICKIMSNLDTLIGLKQNKYNKLINIKTSMLEKMFPREGENTPEIRFKEFEEPWQPITLDNVVDVCSGRDYKHLLEGNIPVYGTGGYMLSVNEALSYDKDAIGIGRKGTIDNPYILKAPFWTVDTLFYSIPKNNYDIDFIYSIFKRIDWKKKDESTGVPSLSKVAINSIEVLVPKYSEQTKIGEYFKKLDNLLSLNQQELEMLRNIRKSLLEKMFI